MELLVSSLEVGNLIETGSAPACPEVKQNHLVLAYVVREFCSALITVFLIQNGSLKINVRMSKAGSQLSLCHGSKLQQGHILTECRSQFLNQSHQDLGLKHAVVLNQLLITVQFVGVLLNALSQNRGETLLKVTHLGVELAGIAIGGKSHADLILQLIGLLIEDIGIVVELLECIVVGCTCNQLVVFLKVYHNDYLSPLQEQLAASHALTEIKCDNGNLSGVGLTLESELAVFYG